MNEIPIKPNKQYQIIYIGNFSPPHKGHIYILDKLINMFPNYENIKINIYLFGDENRHGISTSISEEIWNIYISKFKIVPSIKKMSSLLSDLKNLKKKEVIFLRGNDMSQYNLYKGYKGYCKILRNNSILPSCLIIDKIIGCSSTLLCKELENDINSFLPEFLSEDEKNKIKNLLNNKNVQSLQ